MCYQNNNEVCSQINVYILLRYRKSDRFVILQICNKAIVNLDILQIQSHFKVVCQ